MLYQHNQKRRPKNKTVQSLPPNCIRFSTSEKKEISTDHHGVSNGSTPSDRTISVVWPKSSTSSSTKARKKATFGDWPHLSGEKIDFGRVSMGDSTESKLVNRDVSCFNDKDEGRGKRSKHS